MEGDKINIACGIVLIVENSILLVKHTSEYGGNYSIPKGSLEDNETLSECALRELKEETGIKLSKNQISQFPEVLHIRNSEGEVVKRVYYFIAKFSNFFKYRELSKNDFIDSIEIDNFKFYTYEHAEFILPISQLSVLHHLNYTFSKRELFSLLKEKLINRSIDLKTGLYIYNYSDYCKEISYWNHTTLCCRGLILDKNFKVIARPFKKFFEWNRIPIELQSYIMSLDIKENISSYEKIDGNLIILFYYGGKWNITNRRRFDYIQSYDANLIFNNNYHHLIPNLNTQITYLFESTIRYEFNVVEYDFEDLVLLCGINIKSGKIIQANKLNLDFRIPKKFNDIDFNNKIITEKEEGKVYCLNDKFFIKNKTDWFYKKYQSKLHLFM